MRSASLIALALATGTIAAGCTADVVIDNDNLGCDFDTDCFADEFCDAGVCVPLGAATYQACGVSEDCADPAELCYEVDIPEAGTFGAFCSNDCLGDSECLGANGFGGVCYALGADPVAICYQQCDFDEDCYLASVCIETSLGGGVIDLICAPN